MVEADKKAKSIKVNLTSRSRVVIEAIREDSGVPNTEAMARILEWFAGLDRKLRLAVLSRDAGTQSEMLTLLLRQMLAEQATVADFGPVRDLELPELLHLGQAVSGLAAEKVKLYGRMTKAQAERGGRPSESEK